MSPLGVFLQSVQFLSAVASITEGDVEFEPHAAMKSLIVVTVTMKQRFECLLFRARNFISTCRIRWGAPSDWD